MIGVLDKFKVLKNGFLILVLSGTTACCNYVLAQEDNKVFSFSGSLESFTKAGFNQQSINLNEGAYPTESFSTIFGKFDTEYNVLNIMQSDFITNLKFGLGVAAAGLTWDSTRHDIRDSAANKSSGLTTGSGLNNNYIGAYFGPNSKGQYSSGAFEDSRYFMVHNAYMDLQTKYFNIKAGRYESSMDYYTGYVQGFNIDTHFGYGDKNANPNNDIKIWWFSGFGRAFAYSQWFLDYYFVKATNINGKHINHGIHSFGVDINYGGFTQNDGFKAGYNLMVRPFFWFYPGLYEAPGMKIVYENHFGNGYGIKATLQGFVLNVHNKSDKFSDGAGGKRYDQQVDKLSENLNIIVQAFIYDYNVRIGFYKNFGSANSHFATYGNPMGLDYWTASVYDIGASISDIISRNSTSVYLSGGGWYETKLGTFSWDLLGRITRSPRSNEESIALNLNHSFKNNISLGFKIEWLRDTTKAGFNPGFNISGSSALKANRTDDRSHIFATFAYIF
ncbi:hypothetical protein LS73_007040 [Helicobacter muridarum]|uniref:Putative outer membrane protein n=1 Tax=Helicobacter muridarum TaxID=216 RepID=A0A377PWZ5_9HELI|nr:outer membrane family protein [Helicobacter muridarum]TLD99617.1 hypothetical protein LS73_007040 [Helicobacter muridarum]STQ86771.1 putative outer membrane protein [Helicobacter muridarum]